MKKTLFTLLALVTSFAVVHAKETQPKHEDSIADKRNKILQENDLNKDGKLDSSEIDTMLQKKKEKHEAHHQEMLTKYDANKNGKLDFDERAKMKSDQIQSRNSSENKTNK
ncbi:MAG: hypothetical protein V4507_11790 [Verrucomicrobiota bacterium]